MTNGQVSSTRKFERHYIDNITVACHTRREHENIQKLNNVISDKALLVTVLAMV